jgi:hypothetical protein
MDCAIHTEGTAAYDDGWSQAAVPPTRFARTLPMHVGASPEPPAWRYRRPQSSHSYALGATSTLRC